MFSGNNTKSYYFRLWACTKCSVRIIQNLILWVYTKCSVGIIQNRITSDCGHILNSMFCENDTMICLLHSDLPQVQRYRGLLRLKHDMKTFCQIYLSELSLYLEQQL